MKGIDRRRALDGNYTRRLPSPSLGLAIVPKAAKSLPLADIKASAVKPEGLVEEARVTVHVHPRLVGLAIATGVAGGTGDVRRVRLALAAHSRTSGVGAKQTNLTRYRGASD